VETPDGLMVIDGVPLEAHLQKKLENVGGIFLTYGNHQRSAWRFRQEIGASIYAPVGAAGLEEYPRMSGSTRGARCAEASRRWRPPASTPPAT